MSDIKLDLEPGSPTYGDILIENGEIVLVDGKEAILQDILQTLRTFLEEWFLDLSVGVPWLQQILVKNPNLNHVDALLIDAIGGVPGVDQITFFQSELDPKTR